MSDLHVRVLDLVGEVSAQLELEDFRSGLLVALRRALPCEYVSINQVAPEAERNWSVVDPPMSPAQLATFYRLALQNPLADHFLRTRDGRPLRISDLSTREQFHATELYCELYQPLGVEHQIAFALPSDDLHIIGVALSRCGHDFSDAERDLLSVARPHLIQAYRNALRYSNRAATPHGPDERELRALGLTPAQARVLKLIATGRSSADIADELSIAPRTVHKHLQRTYATLGVKDRSAAAGVAWRAVRFSDA